MKNSNFKLSFLFLFLVLFFDMNVVFAKYESERQNIYDFKEFFEELYPEEEEEIEYTEATNNLYWWPIGSEKTTDSNGVTFASDEPENTVITSYFGYRGAVYDSSGNQISGNAGHGALDIANTKGVGVTNIIAAQSGVVVYPTKNDITSCVDGGSYDCGGGYGNYVIIQHNDGNYTLYGHLAKDSITVTAGESVSQGQVIGKMGTSGNSSGTHLHFEVRVGQNNHAGRVDPLTYVSQENPRPMSVSSSIDTFIAEFEGTGPTDGDYYVAYKLGDGYITIGKGVTWENHSGRFKKYGITSLSEGSKVSKKIVDAVKDEILKEYADGVRSTISNCGITLKQHQIDALTSRRYNTGNLVGFCEAYKKYGETDELYDNYMSKPVTDQYGNVYGGLKKRRLKEWNLFKNGDYSTGG